jgi:hypothetical protein
MKSIAGLDPKDTPALIDEWEYTPRQFHEWFGGPPESTQAKQRLYGTFGPYIKRGRSVRVLGRHIREQRQSLIRISTSDPGSAGR